MQKDKNTYNHNQEAVSQETPERSLWFAVIERALKDYCYFFDRLNHSNSNDLLKHDNTNKLTKNEFNLKAIAELNRLRWFIFAKDPIPFNLEYLSEQLYDDGHGIASQIRKEAAKHFKLNLMEAENTGQYIAIIRYVYESTTAYKAEPASEESKLRHKRFRVLV